MLLSTCCVPSTVLGSENSKINENSQHWLRSYNGSSNVLSAFTLYLICSSQHIYEVSNIVIDLEKKGEHDG